MSKEEDFGFSFEEDVAVDTAVTEDLVAKVATLTEENERLFRQNRDMYKKIIVFLNNLKKDPEKPVIKWPKRSEAIEKFISELDALHEKAKKI